MGWTTTPQEEFCRWVFEQDSKVVIAVGHSGFMLDFFKALIPEHDGKAPSDNAPGSLPQSLRCRRIPTGSMVQFSLLRSHDSSAEQLYYVVPGSIKFLHGQDSF